VLAACSYDVNRTVPCFENIVTNAISFSLPPDVRSSAPPCTHTLACLRAAVPTHRVLPPAVLAHPKRPKLQHRESDTLPALCRAHGCKHFHPLLLTSDPVNKARGAPRLQFHVSLSPSLPLSLSLSASPCVRMRAPKIKPQKSYKLTGMHWSRPMHAMTTCTIFFLSTLKP